MVNIIILYYKNYIVKKFSVDDGAILDLILDNFTHPPPMGFEKIMIEQSLL